MSRVRHSLARYATDVMFCHILSFEEVSAPLSNKLNFCPFPWIELLNKIQTSIFFQILLVLLAAVPQDVTRRDSMFCHISLKRQEKRNYLSLWEMVLYSIYRKSPPHGRYPRSVWFLECRKY